VKNYYFRFSFRAWERLTKCREKHLVKVARAGRARQGWEVNGPQPAGPKN